MSQPNPPSPDSVDPRSVPGEERRLIGGTVVPDSNALDDATEIIVDNLLWDYATFLNAPAESPSYDAASAQYDASREALRQRVHNLVNEAREEGPHIQRELAPKAVTFDELIEHGKAQGVPLYDGYPWSFNYAGYAVTHENNDLYLITTPTATLRFNRGEMLHVAGDEIFVEAL